MQGSLLQNDKEFQDTSPSTESFEVWDAVWLAAQCTRLGSWSCSCPIPSSLFPKEKTKAQTVRRTAQDQTGGRLGRYTHHQLHAPPGPRDPVAASRPASPPDPDPAALWDTSPPTPTPCYASTLLCGATFLREVQSEDSISSKTKNPFLGSA